MRELILIIGMFLIYGCANISNLSQNLSSKNVSLVKEVDLPADFNYSVGYQNKNGLACEYNKSSYRDECLSLPKESFISLRTKLKKINNNEKSNLESEYEIFEGSNILVVDCYIVDSSNNLYRYTKNTLLLDVNLKKGHVYELYPMYIKGRQTSSDSCIIELHDIIKI